MRDFTYNEEELAAGNNEYFKLASEKKKQVGPLVRWLKVNFGETFTAWIHIKALRVFVESVLRWVSRPGKGGGGGGRGYYGDGRKNRQVDQNAMSRYS